MKFFWCLIAVFISLYIPVAGYAQRGQDSVIVLPVKMAVPAGAKKLGTLKAGNNATETKCDYEEVIRSAKEKARMMGGNIVKITQLVAPAFISKCYSIRADVYYATVLPDYHLQKAGTDPIMPADNNYAVLYIYRMKDTELLASSYKLHLDADTVICTVRSKSRDSVKIYKTGTITLWGDIEKRQELKLVVKPGGKYYIRCGVRKGEIRMVPVIELVDKDMGKMEYEQLKKGKKDMDIRYLQEIH